MLCPKLSLFFADQADEIGPGERGGMGDYAARVNSRSNSIASSISLMIA